MKYRSPAMEIQGWLYVCDIQGVPAHQLSCGQAAPTVWYEKYCALNSAKLWMVQPDVINQFFSDPGDSHHNPFSDSISCSSISEEVFHGDFLESESATDGRRRRQNEGPTSPDAPDGLFSKSFLQKKITPGIRRTRSNKHMPGKENRPNVDMTSLMNTGGTARPPESDVGSTFFMPTIESPDMLDLSGEEEAIVRPLHHSILGKEHCFEVITVNGSRCFCCKSAGEREAWIEKIKRTLNPNLDNSRRTEHQLNLWVQEAKGVPIKKKYFCEICLDRQLYARTTSKLKDDNTTFWGEHFDFTSIPDIENITVHLYKDSDKKKKKDKDYVGLVNVSVQTLANRQVVEKWYPLSTPSGNNRNKSGETMAIRIKSRFQSVCVLPMEQYKEFAELVSRDYMAISRKMRTALTVAKKDELSRSLVSIMHATGTIKEFMTEIVMNDIADVEEESLIFRENTIATKAVEHFLRLVGMGYLHEALGDFVHTIYESEEDCEVDGSRLPVNAILEHNQKNLQMCCEIAMCKIISSIKFFPSELREVFSTWRARCEACNRPRIASRLVTASLFLRLLCPSILNPSLFALANELPRPNAARTLTLVAKVIQNLANRTRFGDKEEYMKFMNGFVREQWDQMGEFINSVSDAAQPSVANGFEGFIDLGRELAKLHAFFTECLPTIDPNIINELGDLPNILARITDRVKNPPGSQVGTPVTHNGSRASSHISALDRIAEDIHLSNANDNIMLPPESSSTPFTERRVLVDESGSLMDLVAEGFPNIANSAFSQSGSQTSIPATGSFNNSNNSHRPSLASTENLTEMNGPSAPAQRYLPPRWISQQTKPPLSFINPAYQRQPPDLQRGISSPASLSMTALDQQTDPTVPKGMKFGPSNGMDPSKSMRNLDQAGQLGLGAISNPSSTVNSPFGQPASSAYTGQPQPLSFTNPLQGLQVSSGNISARRGNSTISPAASMRSNSQLETVFTTETVTYSTKHPYASVVGPQPAPRNTVSQARLATEHASPVVPHRPGPLKIVQDSDSLDRGSSGGDSVNNDSYHSNDSLSSRPSSTTTGSTATSGTANNYTAKGERSRVNPQRPRTSHPQISTNHQQIKPFPHIPVSQGNLPESGLSPSEPNKPTAMATSTSIPVASARHCTGLQKQQTGSPSKSTPSTAASADSPGARRTSVASDASKASTRASRTSGVALAKNGRVKTQQAKYPSLQLAQIEQDAVLALSEELPVVREDEDQLVSSKAVTSTSMSAANATRVRMPRKTRPNVIGSVGNTSQHNHASSKSNTAGDKYQGPRRSSYQRSAIQQQPQTSTPTEPTAFPPSTSEGPLSPEERTAQWILSSVAPVAKDPATEADPHRHPMEIGASANVNYGPSKSSRSTAKDYDDVISRLKSDVEVLRSRLSDVEESNRAYKRREEAWVEQIKNGEYREARVREKVRLLEEKFQRQAQEKEEKKSEFVHRINKVEAEQKREREEFQGIIDEKDMIVTAQRKRIDSLEEANARLMRAVNQLREMTAAHAGSPAKVERRGSRHRQAGPADVLSSYTVEVNPTYPARQSDTTNNANNNARRNRPRNAASTQQLAVPYHRRTSGQSRQEGSPTDPDITPEYAIENGAPTASFVNGEFRIEGLSSAGSSSSSV